MEDKGIMTSILPHYILIPMPCGIVLTFVFNPFLKMASLDCELIYLKFFERHYKDP